MFAASRCFASTRIRTRVLILPPLSSLMNALRRICVCPLLGLLALFSIASMRAAPPDAIVAADGSAQYKTVRAAIDACPQITHPGKHWTILVKNGTYRELVYIQREKRF